MFWMKLSTPSYKTTIVIAGSLTVLFWSPPFIPADADDVLNNETSNAVIVLQSPRRVTTNADVSQLPQQQPLVELQEQPKKEEPNPNLAEYRPSQDLPVPSPNRSLLAVTASTSAKGLTAMRFIEKARNLLKAGEQEKALATLEKALGLEANPYVYFYLSQVHYQLGHYQAALNFLEVAESWLDQQPDWSPQITALKAGIPDSGFVQQVIPSQITMAVSR
jgi:tetratricopeptide (TPR) repeat protein